MRLLFIDGSTKLQTVRDLETNARGGMVTSLFKVTDYLAKRHDVTVLSDIREEGKTAAGVSWLRDLYPGKTYDALVCNRGIGDGYPQIPAAARILWTHDLPHAGFAPDPQVLRAFACTVFMSYYAERVWRGFYRHIGHSVLIPNGVDKDLFFPREKDLDYLIYASAPNRGLHKLPFIFDAIKGAVGRPLRCRAYSNLAKLHPNEGADTFDYEAIRRSNVELCDPIPQAEIAQEIGKAGLMLMPSAYPEICSNIILQALASGTPVVTTGWLGSANEWIRKESGYLTQFQPHDYEVYTLDFIRGAVGILKDEDAHIRLMDGAYKANVLSWDKVGEQWEKLLWRCS